MAEEEAGGVADGGVAVEGAVADGGVVKVGVESEGGVVVPDYGVDKA